MRKVIVTEFVTLDGVTEAPGGEPKHPHAGWALQFPIPWSSTTTAQCRARRRSSKVKR